MTFLFNILLLNRVLLYLGLSAQLMPDVALLIPQQPIPGGPRYREIDKNSLSLRTEEEREREERERETENHPRHRGLSVRTIVIEEASSTTSIAKVIACLPPLPDAAVVRCNHRVDSRRHPVPSKKVRGEVTFHVCDAITLDEVNKNMSLCLLYVKINSIMSRVLGDVVKRIM